jgi:geranylgeranyl diphosphate synthase type II
MKAKMNISATLKDIAVRVDQAIVNYCDQYLIGPDRLLQAMRYSLLAGGKRIRPALVLLNAELCGGSQADAMIPAVAIEMIHTFSLIHDDLPAMDNDDFRRGKPTNHKMFGEAMAILAGDALQTFAFELIGDHYNGPADRKAKLMTELARATGPAGMTGGQVLDMTFGQEEWTLAAVEKIHLLKTAALIRCACRMGAICAGAEEAEYDIISEYGLKIGLTFQIVDDYLDQTSSEGAMGKGVGKDAAHGKPNYALLAGSPAAAWQRATELVDEAKNALVPFGESAETLQELAEVILKRRS